MHNHQGDVKFMHDLQDAAPEMVAAFFNFDKVVFNKDIGSLKLATRELIAVGVAVTTQCSYCIADHAKRAVSAGASKQDVAEAIMVATALRAGGGITHGWQAMKKIAETK
ncbi:carboxymuconolactone decarboxylase family protein [Pseudomonas sp. CFSAN084952]|jgi:AhpD family alkylhydroperoxidase|uniref:carboxymuconolactone decarboxylase family protein n=1 Tax=Pseudomonas TaxID=286 RepID=UPI001299FB37|nr:carboxymuconolactone decarboxylase family protein [Pseudomonas sp. CFSAN084952]QGF93544.1 carboxymuconolactone decarboxylase family protein [Pseudomonas sp. CFSAN084952]